MNPEYVTALFKRIFEVQASTCENQHEDAKIRSKRYYDCKANLKVFKRDHYVYLLKELLVNSMNNTRRIRS